MLKQINKKIKIAGLVLLLAIAAGGLLLWLNREEPKPKIAIVIDDWGYSGNNLSLLLQIERPLTISILPNLAYSSRIARRVAREGYEVILHLPLEPHRIPLTVPVEGERIGLEPETIYVNMPEEEVIKRLYKALESVAYAKGVSNHMGSKATEDSKLMGIILRELKEKGLYFLDSLVTNKSVCKGLANEIGLRFAQRDVFLDNYRDADYIKGQVRQLVRQAIARGRAIGVGHDRRLTLTVLRDMVPEIEKQGVEFVFVSELVD